MEEEDLDEDVFLEETLLQYEEDSQVLRELEESNSIKERLQKWKRPSLSQAYIAQTQSICKKILIEKHFALNFRLHAFVFFVSACLMYCSFLFLEALFSCFPRFLNYLVNLVESISIMVLNVYGF